jgi:hypothetical protein
MVPKVKDDIKNIANESVDATTRSFQGATRVTQAIAGQIADYSKRSFEQGTKTVENLLGARSLDKAVEVQNEYARAAYEDYVSHTTITEMIRPSHYIRRLVFLALQSPDSCPPLPVGPVRSVCRPTS